MPPRSAHLQPLGGVATRKARSGSVSSRAEFDNFDSSTWMRLTTLEKRWWANTIEQLHRAHLNREMVRLWRDNLRRVLSFGVLRQKSSRYRVSLSARTHRTSLQSTAMPRSKKVDQIIPGLDIDSLSARPSLDPEYLICGAFPEQRHHLISCMTAFSPSWSTK